MKKIIAFSIVFSLLAFSQSFGQSYPPGFSITMSGSVPTFNFVTIDNYEDGIQQKDAVIFTVTSHGEHWNIYVRGNNSSFSGSAGTVPLATLKLRSNSSSYIHLSTSDQILENYAGNTYSSPTTKTYKIDYFADDINYLYEPGSYSAGITYTITMP